MRRPILSALVLLTTLGSFGASALAKERRVALLVAHPFGGENLTPLRYTGNDVDRVREVLEYLGGFETEDVLLRFAEDAEAIEDAFADVTETVREAKRSGDEVLFVFYYSGHAKDGDLRLGETRLSLRRVKDLVESTGANLRIAFLDSCRSGSITRLKGATKGEPISMAVEDTATQRGQVLITASSANEDAQESDDIQGSFFTHFVTTGLRGAADDNDDGTVTLSEAYNFAFGNTVAQTIGTRGGVQHPTYRFDLRGAGDVVMTRTGRPPSAIRIPSYMSGHFIVFDFERRIVVAELHKKRGAPLQVGVRPGRYVVKKRETDHLKMQRVDIRTGDLVVVDPEEMDRVAFADDYAKGATITVEEVRHGKIGLRISMVAGPQVFFSGPVQEQYVPVLGLLQFRFDVDNLLRRNFGLRFDFGLGTSGTRTLTAVDPYIGELPVDVTVMQATVGLALTGRWPIREWFWTEGNVRVGWIGVSREKKDIGETETFGTITPGVGLDVNFQIASWFRAGLTGRIHYMFFHGDEDINLAYFDGGLVLTAVVR